MLIEECDPQMAFDEFVRKARAYLDTPGLMAALELDKICMQLYPLVGRSLNHVELSNCIRDFGRALPKNDQARLHALLQEIFTHAEQAGLKLPKA